MYKISNISRWWIGLFVIMLIVVQYPLQAQSGINEFGSFEQGLPSYWTKGTEPSGSTLSWATDQSISMGRSLKITKSATTEAAKWESENMVDLWSEKHFANVDIDMGMNYKTSGVNTNPTTDDQKWFVTYSFYRENGTLIGEKKFELDQSAASSTGWLSSRTTIGEISLPEDSWTTIIRFVGGKDATGTVWADDFILNGRGGWLGQDWNTQVGVPTGWFYWLPPNGGNDGLLNAGYQNTKITDEEAYQGLYSLKFENLEGTHDGFVGTRKYPLSGVVPGDVVRISVWIKGMNLHPDSVIAVGDQWTVAITPTFHNTIGNNSGWGQTWASDIPLKFPNAASFDWQQFYVDVTVPADVVSLAVRLHPLGRFQGTVYMDNLTVEKLDIPTVSDIGSFEQGLPSYWTKGTEPSGSTLSWATDQSISMGRSLKITKSATTEAAKWESENMVDLWSEKHFANVDIDMGMNYKTSGVNTNPTTDDQKWFVTYSFYRENGTLIGEKKFELDQSAASSTGWLSSRTTIGEISLPEDSWTTIIRFVGGKDATGTVWADDFILNGRGGWLGQDWNTQVGVPTGWFYWLPPNGGNDGLLNAGYQNTKITDEEAYQGLYSLKFENLEGTHDGFVGTRKYPLSGVVPGDVVRISVWIKGMNLHPDSVIAVGDQWTVAITPTFHNTIGNNSGWGQTWASDIPLKFPNAASFDWQQFYVDVTVPADVVSLAVRLHPLGRFQGTVYMDNLTVEKLDIPTVSDIGSFEQGLPSYWTKGTEPSGSTLSWATDQSISMGRSLKITKSATTEAAKWESENMVDLWSEKHFANVDIDMGMNYKTSGVNTNPTTDDQKWFVTYSFYRENGTLIGEKKFELDQSAASSTGWLSSRTTIGEISLPEDSWTTIIRFVGGKDATGTVWADDFILNGRGGWLGQDWNTQVGVPTGWFYWLPPNGGNDGLLNAGYQNTKITDEEAYQGLYSLKFENLEGTHDGFVGTRKYAISGEPLLGPIEPKHELQDISTLSGVVPGDILRISVWIKGMNLHPDSVIAVGDQWTVAITPTFHTTIGNNSGWGQSWASDIPLKFPNAASFDWQQFYVDVTVPLDAISLAVRLHPLGRFQGTVYMDQLQIKKNGVTDVQVGTEIPASYNLSQNYPNPFNPSTAINYSIPIGSNVSIVIYDLLGREVKTLINSEQNAGNYQLLWNGDNNYGSKVSSGTYFYSIRSADFTQVRKMILLK